MSEYAPQALAAFDPARVPKPPYFPVRAGQPSSPEPTPA